VALKIRAARMDDIDQLVSLLSVLFSIEKDFEVRPALQRAGLHLLLGSPTALVLVAESAEKVVGMVTLQVVVSTAEGGLSGLVEDFVVLREFRGRGVGSALMRRLEQLARRFGLSRIQLLADKTNEPALAFYTGRQWFRTSMEAWRRCFGNPTNGSP
jgi:ribosomal protein S18 acetylase RimI-like enzyme